MNKSKPPLFSILIANYNNGRYLMEAIDSIKNQYYSNWEVIIVDDYSTDNSKDLYKELSRDKRIIIFLNEKNRGCGYTKARCVVEANGELCAFLDPDDTISSDALAIMAEAHLNYPDASLVYSTNYLCDEGLNIVGINPAVGAIPADKSYLTHKSGNTNISAFAAFKKKFYSRTGGINPLLKRAVDQDLYYKLEEKGDAVFINLPLYFYRRHQGGISTEANALKAKFWHALVVKDAFNRRTKTNVTKNITKEQLAKYFEDYHFWKAQELSERAKCKMIQQLLLSIKYGKLNSMPAKLKFLVTALLK